MDMAEYIKIHNRSNKWLRALQFMFWPYVLLILAIFFWMGTNPEHGWQVGILYAWVGSMALFVFVILLGVHSINPELLTDKPECKVCPECKNSPCRCYP